MSPFGLSPAIWKLEGKKHFAPYSEILFVIRVDTVWVRTWKGTSLVTRIGVQGNKTITSKKKDTFLQAECLPKRAHQSRAQGFLTWPTRPRFHSMGHGIHLLGLFQIQIYSFFTFWQYSGLIFSPLPLKRYKFPS